MRAELTIIACCVNGMPCVHFTSTKLQGDDLWFPTHGNLFITIERLMIANGIAHNVARIDLIREGQTHKDYLVTYNLPK